MLIKYTIKPQNIQNLKNNSIFFNFKFHGIFLYNFSVITVNLIVAIKVTVMLYVSLAIKEIVLFIDILI